MDKGSWIVDSERCALGIPQFVASCSQSIRPSVRPSHCNEQKFSFLSAKLPMLPAIDRLYLARRSTCLSRISFATY